MLALVKTGPGPGCTAVLDRPEPEPGQGDVVVELILAGLCHTDVSFVEWTAAVQSGYRPNFPQVMGHEFVGRVVHDPEGTLTAERVVGSCHVTCGRCERCSTGRSMLCDRRQVIGLDTDGTFAERFVMPRRNLVAVPDQVPDQVAALAEPLAVGAHAMARAEVAPGMRVAVVGPGSVGFVTTACLASIDGVHVTVIGTDRDAAQLRVALQAGADEALTNESGELDGTFDAVIETAGSPTAVESAIRLTKPGGTTVCVGLPPAPASIDTAHLAFTEKRLIGSRAYDLSDWAAMPDLLARLTSLERLDFAVLPFHEFDHGIELVATRQVTKVLLSAPT